LRKALGEADPADLLRRLERDGQVVVELPDSPVTLNREDVRIRLAARPGWAAAQGPAAVVVLSTELTEALRAEGLARELVHAIQNRRKEIGCDYTDRITVRLATQDESLRTAATRFAADVQRETLATDLGFGSLDGVEGTDLKIDGRPATLFVAVDPHVPR